MKPVDADELFQKTIYIINDGTDDKVLRIVVGISLAETVEARPVKHGKWIKRSGNRYMFCIYDCSECRCPNPIKTKYCPNCGVEMKEENND
ncbi:MAG: hypothetical protein K2N27_09810 [Ruminococcus sp.]|nr:hypothetical protein [Ruminococcus sp.]